MSVFFFSEYLSKQGGFLLSRQELLVGGWLLDLADVEMGSPVKGVNERGRSGLKRIV